MALRALKTEEEMAGVPLDQPILVELPSMDDGQDNIVDIDAKKPSPKSDDTAPDVKQLQTQLEALEAAAKTDRARASAGGTWTRAAARTGSSSHGRVTMAGDPLRLSTAQPLSQAFRDWARARFLQAPARNAWHGEITTERTGAARARGAARALVHRGRAIGA